MAELVLDTCPGYELVVERRRGAVQSPPNGGRVRARQRNERHLRLFRFSWKTPSRGLFAHLLELYRDARGTTLPLTLTLPGNVQVEACFDSPPKRTHGNAGRGRVEAEFLEVR